MTSEEIYMFASAVQRFDNAVQLHAIVCGQMAILEGMKADNANRACRGQAPANVEPHFNSITDCIQNAINQYR